VCLILFFNSINVRQFPSLWKIVCEYYTKFQNEWCVHRSVRSAMYVNALHFAQMVSKRTTYADTRDMAAVTLKNDVGRILCQLVKFPKSDCLHSFACPSVLMEKLCFHWTEFCAVLYSGFSFTTCILHAKFKFR
jgi:hypothetical protein